MGDPLDFVDEGGWPYPDDVVDARRPEPVDHRDEADDDLIAWHALQGRGLVPLSPLERAAVVARFGLDGGRPMTMGEIGASLGLSRERTRAAVSGGMGKLRALLCEPGD